MSDKVELFGKILISEVRDETISSLDMMISGKMQGVTAKAIREKLVSFDKEQLEVLEWLLPKVVDLNLHNMLFMLEEHDNITVVVDNEDIKSTSDGLAGELYTEDGWISKFSNERYQEL